MGVILAIVTNEVTVLTLVLPATLMADASLTLAIATAIATVVCKKHGLPCSVHFTTTRRKCCQAKEGESTKQIQY